MAKNQEPPGLYVGKGAGADFLFVAARVAGAGHVLLFRLRANFGSGPYPYP